MPMNHGANQHPIGEKLYIFHSALPNENKCLIFAHGGHLWGDAANFALDPALTLHFMQSQHGVAIETNPWNAMFLLGKPRANILQTLHGGMRVNEYSLGKGVGRHWSTNTISYEQISEKMEAQVGVHADWCPHIVVVRRRFRCMGRLIPLSEAVAQIQAYSQQNGLGIDEIYVATCRGEHEDKRLLSTLARI
ncbi:putative adhesin [Massilia sp. W12]|uniref:putative adhesin n=1 Tax=Massilia sp. W12 TaxID=3126507 RepID=UPI0030CF4562